MTCQHTPCPEGYLRWHSWADRMAKTHRQVKCKMCGLWAIWIPRNAPDPNDDSADFVQVGKRTYVHKNILRDNPKLQRLADRIEEQR